MEQPPSRVETAFEQEERAGLLLATKVRVVALAAVAVMFLILQPMPYGLYNALFMAALALSGGAHAWTRLKLSAGTNIGYGFIALDFLIITVQLFIANPAFWPGLVPEVLYSYGVQALYFLFVMLTALSYAPRLTLWAGAAAGLFYGVVFLWLTRDPEVVRWLLFSMSPDAAAGRMERSDISVADDMLMAAIPRIADITFMLLIAAILAVVVARSRRLVVAQVGAARERANLARYFPPTMVDRLAHLDQPLGPVRTQKVAVLFADIVGFTGYAESAPAEQVVETLREFHGRMEQAVFENGGTLDKFLGDGLMATFGTPNAAADDAARAVSCARSMIAAVEAWNHGRSAQDLPPIKISVGVHFGDAVLGDVGSERRMEFAVLGDTVNVASRLERLTRELDGLVVVSDAVAARARGTSGDEVLAGFRRAEPQAIRGRREQETVWVL